MQISLIVAVAANGIIGRDGELPWRLSSDLKRFRRLTTGHCVMMGRKTFESILARLGKPLPNRKSIVLTRQADFQVPDGVAVAHDWESAMRQSAEFQGESSEVFVIGGEQIYRLAMEHADRIYLTKVEKSVAGDARFPELNETAWRTIESERTEVDENNEAPTTYVVLERQSDRASEAAR